jgi:hypothetical protein
MTVFRSGDALMALGPDLRVDAWNEELESLTGIRLPKPSAVPAGRCSADSTSEGL